MTFRDRASKHRSSPGLSELDLLRLSGWLRGYIRWTQGTVTKVRNTSGFRRFFLVGGVVEPTHLKNMLVKMEIIFPQFSG